MTFQYNIVILLHSFGKLCRICTIIMEYIRIAELHAGLNNDSDYIIKRILKSALFKLLLVYRKSLLNSFGLGNAY